MGANPKRVVQMLWLAAGIMLTIAFVHSFGSGNSAEWVSSGMRNFIGKNEGGGGRQSMKEFMTQAEAIWARSVKDRHDMIRKDWGGDVAKMPLYAAQSGPEYWRSPYTVWDFTPASWSCPHEMQRVGRLGDGGKWVCGGTRVYNEKPCVIYSFGVRDESSFENDMLSATNCSVWAYDFSVVDFGKQVEPKNRDRAKFTQAGIAGKTDKTKDPPFYSIADLMKMNGHDYIDVLKMDIEFAEFEAMDGFSNDFPASAGHELPVGQVMIEIHLFNDITSKQYLDWWERLESRGLRATWTEPNLLAVTLNLDGNKSPQLSEYVFLNVHDSRSMVFGGRL